MPTISFLAQCARRKAFVAAVAFILINCAIAFLAPYVSPYDPEAITLNRLEPPGLNHLFGTDHLGRDVFSRLIWGTRVSLFVAFVATVVALLVGVSLGGIAGYFGGLLDHLVSRFMDLWIIIPSLILLILVVAFFGTNIFYTSIVIGLTIWPSNARIMRAQALSLRERAFVQAVIAAGGGRLYTLFKHIIPNSIAPVIPNSTLNVGLAVLTEAALSFIGLGDPRQISWGTVLYNGRETLQTAWWVATFSGLPILALTYAFVVVGDIITDVTQPQLQEVQVGARVL